MWWVVILILSSCALFPVGFCVGFCTGTFSMRWWINRNSHAESRGLDYDRRRGYYDEEEAVNSDYVEKKKKHKKKKKETMI